MKLKKFLTRATSSLLALNLALSAPLTSFAARDLNDFAAGNTQAGVVTGSGGDFSANVTGTNSSGKIGIRLTLVDRNSPEKIVSVDSQGNPMTVDLLYVTKDAWDHQAYSGTYRSTLYDQYRFINPRTQGLYSEADSIMAEVAGQPYTVNKQIYKDQIDSWFQGQETIVPWLIHTGGKYTSQGEQFVKWCTTDADGNEAVGVNGSLFTVTMYGETYMLAIHNESTNIAPALLAESSKDVGIPIVATSNELLSNTIQALEDFENGVGSFTAFTEGFQNAAARISVTGEIDDPQVREKLINLQSSLQKSGLLDKMGTLNADGSYTIITSKGSINYKPIMEEGLTGTPNNQDSSANRQVGKGPSESAAPSGAPSSGNGSSNGAKKEGPSGLNSASAKPTASISKRDLPLLASANVQTKEFNGGEYLDHDRTADGLFFMFKNIAPPKQVKHFLLQSATSEKETYLVNSDTMFSINSKFILFFHH